MVPYANEVESEQRALEVTVIWGDNEVLRIDHLQPVRAWSVGESQADFTIGAELLGTRWLQLVTASGAVAIPDGASGEVCVGSARLGLRELIESGHAQHDAGWSYALPPGASARVCHRGFTFQIRSVRAGKVIGREHRPFDLSQQIWTGLSFAIHGLFLAAMYLLPPGASALSLEMLSEDARVATYLMRPAEAEEPMPDWTKSDSSGGADGRRAKGAEGQAGETKAPKRNTSYAIAGHVEHPQLAREQAIAEARSTGILGALASAKGAWNSPTSLFGADEPLGYDPANALGALFGNEIGDAEGFGGLALRGTGRAGGGNGEGTIGIGGLGTVGHGGGGEGPGYGRGTGGLGTRAAHVPQLRVGTADVKGSLSKDVIRRVIQRRLNEVRFCYEQELNARPDLRGRVQVKFVIAPDGAVRAAEIQGSTLGVHGAEACIRDAVRRWSFPAPDGGGIVIVSYPFLFEQAQ